MASDVQDALQAAWELGVPKAATALYARWWQLETWLRELLYLELQASLGPNWIDELPPRAGKYEATDTKQPYMATPDATVRFAYLDVGDLLGMVEAHWALVGPALLDDLPVWTGRVQELNKIRRRIAHCRRPHPDDLSRLEQTLRDLDSGAHRYISALNSPYRWWPALPPTSPEPLAGSWVRNEHPDASRLVEHCARQYGIHFRLACSRRPWAAEISEAEQVSGTPGYLWHATWDLGEYPGNARAVWEWPSVADQHESIAFFLAESHNFEFTFSAVVDPNRIADLIGIIFDAVAQNLRPPMGYRKPRSLSDDGGWYRLHRNLDWRVKINSAWNVVTADMPVSIFQA